jgi:hypothetical protein
MAQALAIQDQTTEVVPIQPADAKAWELVHSVLTYMSANTSYNYSEAFRELGVSRASFYRAIKRPFVQGRMAERMDAVDLAVERMLEDHWVLVVSNMLCLAQGGGREAVAAARFLAEQKGRIQERGGAPKEEGPSEARRLLDSWMGTSKTVTARRSVVTEEVELTPGDALQAEVIEGA